MAAAGGSSGLERCLAFDWAGAFAESSIDALVELDRWVAKLRDGLRVELHRKIVAEHGSSLPVEAERLCDAGSYYCASVVTC